MELTRLATAAGHRDPLLEESTRLGGMLEQASLVHPDNRPFLDWLRAAVEASGADVRLGVTATSDLVAELAPDVVVVATGAAWDLPDVLDGAQLGRRVTILGGGLAGGQLAEHLASRGHLVAVVEAGPELAPEVGPKRRTELMDRLDRLGVTVHVDADPARLRIPADDVIRIGVAAPDTALRDAIAVRLPEVEVHAIGDATGPGLIRGATDDAARLVHTLNAAGPR
jgi:2,4-dienoyl-CoA reductase (NADPH2)